MNTNTSAQTARADRGAQIDPSTVTQINSGTWNVAGSKGRVYVVSAVRMDGRECFECSCPDFRFRANSDPAAFQCKHGAAVRLLVEGPAVTVEAEPVESFEALALTHHFDWSSLSVEPDIENARIYGRTAKSAPAPLVLVPELPAVDACKPRRPRLGWMCQSGAHGFVITHTAEFGGCCGECGYAMVAVHDGDREAFRFPQPCRTCGGEAHGFRRAC